MNTYFCAVNSVKDPKDDTAKDIFWLQSTPG